MKFEKRADGGDVTPSSETPDTGKKPVIIYILILFLAAFMLMFLSLLAHQRSNSEALGQLQNSVSAIQEIQSRSLICKSSSVKPRKSRTLRKMPPRPRTTVLPRWKRKTTPCWRCTIFNRSMPPEIWTAAA